MFDSSYYNVDCDDNYDDENVLVHFVHLYQDMKKRKKVRLQVNYNDKKVCSLSLVVLRYV